jgi:xanthine dehydrogenase/oxidase
MALNQGGALVHVYTDGNILLTHGGVEMGQGLHTKMVQVCARALGVSPSKVHISEMATNTVANSSASAASFSTDLYGMAVKNASEEIKSRLSPYMEANPKGKWEDWVRLAYLDRVNLSANGFYKSNELVEMDWTKGEGCPFSYFTYGVACSEVEVDLLTGDHRILRTDIVMDVGESLNPAIDIGQIEGGFAQGYGLFMMEEHVFLDGDEKMRGTMVTNGPGAYKIPGFSDIPTEFNVSLLKGVPNKRAIYSSKAIGEPPLFLASSVFFAVREAIASSRQESGVDVGFRMDSPATCERIRMACVDKMVQLGASHVVDKGRRWNVVV